METETSFSAYTVFVVIAMLFVILGLFCMMLLIYHTWIKMRLEYELHHETMRLLEDLEYDRKQEKTMRIKDRRQQIERDKVATQKNSDYKKISDQLSIIYVTCASIKNSIEANNNKGIEEKDKQPPKKKE